MSVRQDAERIVLWLHAEHDDDWITLADICDHFGWLPTGKTYLRMSKAREFADDCGLCLTFATWRKGSIPTYKLTGFDGDDVVPGMATRAKSASSQWFNIERHGRFVQRHGTTRLTRKVGKLAAETAASNRQQQNTLAEILTELDR